MIAKILGIIDIFAAVCFLIFASFGVMPMHLILVLGIYLLVKGGFFLISMDVASILDIICGIAFFASTAVTIPKIIIFIVAIFLLQKGIFSMLSS